MSERWIIGAMSGTSADGADAAIVRLPGRTDAARVELHGFRSTAYEPALRERILQTRVDGAATLREFAALARDIADVYADLILNLLHDVNLPPERVEAIAAHGQTLFHDPPLTIQQFDPAHLAWRTGIAVVSDFRRADCAAGGQGAPLVPFADEVLFRSASEDRVVLNLGGIANVTLLPAGAGREGVTGFDVGPGNCLSDGLMRDAGGANLGVDLGGAAAQRGTADAAVVERFLAEDYVRRAPPKSTDGPAMVAAFRRAMGSRPMPLEDELATAAAIVAECVLRQTPGGSVLIAAGGGVHNRAIMRRLEAERKVARTDDYGIPAQAREAVAFAILGAATLDRVPANLPRVTGASRPVVLGAITPRP